MATRDEIAATLREILHTAAKVPTETLAALDEQAPIKDALRLDSLDMIEVVYEVEDRFDVQIPEERVQEIRTFAEIVDGLHEALQAKG